MSSEASLVREDLVGSSPPLAARVGIPPNACGAVIFAHGSGSGRLSPRNNYVATRLRERGFATILLDLLSPEEEGDRRNVFDINLLAARLVMAVDWASGQESLSDLPIGYFGASTGAGAALKAACADSRIGAVVSRGGRPDLAGEDALRLVTAPTLLIVGSRDVPVIELNQRALRHLTCSARLEIVPGATHLFEEPGTLTQVVGLAATWFKAFLVRKLQ